MWLTFSEMTFYDNPLIIFLPMIKCKLPRDLELWKTLNHHKLENLPILKNFLMKSVLLTPDFVFHDLYLNVLALEDLCNLVKQRIALKICIITKSIQCARHIYGL
jgi:hypothetical protein